jgi:hypothetical protein
MDKASHPLVAATLISVVVALAVMLIVPTEPKNRRLSQEELSACLNAVYALDRVSTETKSSTRGGRARAQVGGANRGIKTNEHQRGM